MTKTEPAPRTFTLILIALFFLGVSILLFSRSMNRRFSHDEHQFIASAVLLSDSGLLPYQDFPYHHSPYLTYVNALLFNFGDRLLFSARTASVLFSVLGAGVIYLLVCQAFSRQKNLTRHLAAGSAVLVLITNPFFYRTSGKAWNHDLPTLLVLLAIFVVFQAQRREKPDGWMALSGFLVGLAGGVRLSYLLVLPVFLLSVLAISPQVMAFSRFRRLLGAGGGAALAGLPLIWHFVRAPQKFLYGNFLYPRLNMIYREELGHEVGMTLVGKLLLLATELWADWHSLVLYIGFILLTVGILSNRIARRSYAWKWVLLLSLVPALLAGGLVPTPAWRHYFYAPIPFIVLAIFIGLGKWIRGGKSELWIGLALIPLLFGLLSHGKDDLAHLQSLGRSEDWITQQIHDLGERVAAQVGTGRVLTLAPVVPLEGGAQIYPALVNGPFTWRTTNYLSKERQQAYGVLVPRELGEYLENNPPAGILTGFEASGSGFQAFQPGGLEAPFKQYAVDHEYLPVELTTDVTSDPIILWVRPIR